VLAPGLSAAACEPLVTDRTRAIMHMPYGGHPGEARALEDLARRHGLALLVDAAHAVGARCGGRAVGSLGVAAAYSFFANKNLAIGEGGMVTTDDDDIARMLRLTRSHGMTALSWDQANGHAFGYDVVALGFNYRLDEPRAALGRARLERLDEENARRARPDARYRAALAGVVDCALAPCDDVQPSHHLFTIVLPPHVDRDAFRRRLAERGVQTSVHYPPAHGMAIHSRPAVELPVTEDYARRTVTLPLFAHMTDGQQDRVTAELGEALDAG
jgi:dTDP-4-amino-4,6-dideoxygalactose transaminase